MKRQSLQAMSAMWYESGMILLIRLFHVMHARFVHHRETVAIDKCAIN